MGNLSLQDRIELVTLKETYRLGVEQITLPFQPYVSGIEATQALQYYKASLHLTDPQDRGTDNSLGLAAFKPAWVRVYVRRGFFHALVRLTGKLVLERQSSEFPITWERIAEYTPIAPGSVDAQQSTDYVTERQDLTKTLNFVVPGADVRGRLRLTAIVWAVGGSAASPLDVEEVIVDATLKQTLRVRGIFVRYTGPNQSGTVPNMNLAAPTVADLQATCGNTLTVYPVQPTAVFSSGGMITWSTPLTGMATKPGGCSQQWLDLNVAVAAAKANDGNRPDQLYVGLLPVGVPIANVGGCNSSGVSAVPNGEQWTMAHELGHAAGLAHGPCLTPGDPNYPAYEPYDPNATPTASLGEYGLDINNGQIHPPTEKDFMSYCTPPWISLFHYVRLYNNASLDPKWVDSPWRLRLPDLVDPWLWPWEYIPDPPSWDLPSHYVKVIVEPVISLVGVVNLAGEVNVSSVMRLRAVSKLREGTPTNMIAELVGANGEVVARSPIMRTEAHGMGCGCGDSHEHGGHGSASSGYAFHALLSDVEPGSALRIVRLNDEDPRERAELWSRKPSGAAPKVRKVTARVEKGDVVIRWDCKMDRGQGAEYSIQFSKDRGKSWNGLTTGVREGEFRTPASELPSGSVVFRVLAHDGFFTSSADAKAVRLSARPPIVSIVHPYDGRTYRTGGPFRLFAAASTHVGAANPKLEFEWQVDGKRVGRGAECWIDAPRPGKHRCRVVARDDGGAAEATVTFVTEGQSDRRKGSPRS